MKWIYDLTYEQLRDDFLRSGIKKFVADQVFQWLYWKIREDINCWTNIAKTNRDLLSQKYDTRLPEIIDQQTDPQGTAKLLFQLKDGLCIESVLIKERKHYTFCISTQVGCALGCKFCATGTLGFKRNLSPGEILGQILALKKVLQTTLPLSPQKTPESSMEKGSKGINDQYAGKINLVFMGMGEPLLNYENLKQALNIITAEKGIAISPRNITVSTAGILDKIKQLEQDFPKLKISFSLNASSHTMREELMPISRKEKLADHLDYFRENAKKRKHRITFEYVMLKGINDSPADVGRIVSLVHGIPCKINLIPYNPNEMFPFKTPSEKTVEMFADKLHAKGHTVIVRWSKGRNIKSACGQLAAKNEK